MTIMGEILFIILGLLAATGSAVGLIVAMMMMPYARQRLGGWALIVIPIAVFGGACFSVIVVMIWLSLFV